MKRTVSQEALAAGLEGLLVKQQNAVAELVQIDRHIAEIRKHIKGAHNSVSNIQQSNIQHIDGSAADAAPARVAAKATKRGNGRPAKTWTPAQRKLQRDRMKAYWAAKRKADAAPPAPASITKRKKAVKRGARAVSKKVAALTQAA